MRPLPIILVIAACMLLFSAPVARPAGAGVRVFAPQQPGVTADSLPLSYNGSFIVQNDGPTEGVYLIRVSVDDPGAITWVNVSPSGFVLAPGGLRVVNFSIDIGEGQAGPGTYHVVFMPALLPRDVEPYLDTFANYVATVDRYNLTVEISGGQDVMSAGTAAGTPVVFSEEDTGRINLVQYMRPESEGRIVTQIDRAVRINVPDVATAGEPVPISLSVFQDLSPAGIGLMAISPEGDYYPVQGGNFTFDRAGKWGVIALVGNDVLLGRPVDVGPAGARLVMPGMDTILAAISLLLLLAVVPIWLLGKRATARDPYQDVAYKAYVVGKYIGHFDPPRLRRAVGAIAREYDDLVAGGARGDRERARSTLDELRTLAGLEPDAS